MYSSALALSKLTLSSSTRKAGANVQEVQARQQLDSLRRDEKAQHRALLGINEKVGQFEGRKQKLDEEKASMGEKKTEVSLCQHARHNADGGMVAACSWMRK